MNKKTFLVLQQYDSVWAGSSIEHFQNTPTYSFMTSYSVAEPWGGGGFGG